MRFAFVLGFGLIFTLLGLSAVYALAAPLREPTCRCCSQIGGVVLILLGLNLMGVLRCATPRAIVEAIGSLQVAGSWKSRA